MNIIVVTSEFGANKCLDVPHIRAKTDEGDRHRYPLREGVELQTQHEEAAALFVRQMGEVILGHLSAPSKRDRTYLHILQLLP